MSEAGELATLVADLLGALDAWQRTGATSLPVGALDGLPTGPVEVARVAPSAAPRPARPEPPRALPQIGRAHV